MRSLLLLILSVTFIACSARSPQSAYSALRAKRSDSQCSDWYQYYYCSNWKYQGYCQQNSQYYPSMKMYCKKTCDLCHECMDQPYQSCVYWEGLGYCTEGNYYYDYMKLNCPATCNMCEPPTTQPVTTTPSTTSKPLTTNGPSTNATTTSSPSTTSKPTTTNSPTTASNSSTTSAPSTTSKPTTTKASTTASNSSTTSAPSTTSKPTTTKASTTASNSSTTNAPTTTSSPSTTSGPSTTSNPSTTDAPATTPTPAENTCLEGHNYRRALHGASSLIWNETLVQHAQIWANHLANTGVVEHDKNRPKEEGENLAWFQGDPGADCTDALVGWYDNEEPKYDYNSPGFSNVTGHFTQVVWKATTAIGVAQASTGLGLGKQIYIVARYSPPGNIGGSLQYSQNVGNKQSS